LIPLYYLGPLTGEGKKKEYSYIKLQILRIILGCLWTFKKKNRKKNFYLKRRLRVSTTAPATAAREVEAEYYNNRGQYTRI